MLALGYCVVLAAAAYLLIDRFFLHSDGASGSSHRTAAEGPEQAPPPTLGGLRDRMDALPTDTYSVHLTVRRQDEHQTRPLAGADVFAIERTPDGATRALWTGSADAKGAATFSLDAAPVTIVVRHKGLLGASHQIAAPPSDDSVIHVSLTLRPLASLRVAVTDTRGEPIESARATLLYPRGLGHTAALFQAADRSVSQTQTRRSAPDGLVIFGEVVPDIPIGLEVTHADFGSFSSSPAPLKWGEDRREVATLERGGQVSWTCVPPHGEVIISGLAAVMPVDAEVIRPVAQRDLRLGGAQETLSGLGEGKWRIVVTARLQPSNGAVFYSHQFTIQRDESLDLGELLPQGQTVEFSLVANSLDTSGRRLRISLHSLERATEDRLRVSGVHDVYVPAAQERVTLHGLSTGVWRVSAYLTKPWSTVPDMTFPAAQHEFSTPTADARYELRFEREAGPTGSVLLRVSRVPEGQRGEPAFGTSCVYQAALGTVAVLPRFSVEVGAVFPLTHLGYGEHKLLAWGGGGYWEGSVFIQSGSRAVVDVDLSEARSAQTACRLVAPHGEIDDWFPLLGEWYLPGARTAEQDSPMPLGSFKVSAGTTLDLELPPGRRVEIHVRGPSGKLAKATLDAIGPGQVHRADVHLQVFPSK